MSNEKSLGVQLTGFFPKRDRAGVIFAGILCFASFHLLASNVTLGWTASTDASTSGYAVYWGTDGVTFSNRLDAGNNTNFTVTNLAPGTTNYFQVTAYNMVKEGAPCPMTQYYVSTTTVNSSASVLTYGQAVTFSATVASFDGAGTVSFYADGGATPMPGCSALPLVNGTAITPEISYLSAGNHTISAVYSGDAISASSSGTLNGGQTVTPATLVVTATGVTKVYDGTTAATVVLSDNRLSGDQITDSYVSAQFASAGIANGVAISVTGISVSGPSAGNYVLSSTTTTATANIVSTLPTWVGADAAHSSNWSDGTNWAAGTPPDLTGDNLVFSGVVGLSPVMNNSYTASSLAFDSAAGSFTLTATAGSVLTLSGAVNDYSSNAQYLALPVALGAPSQWSIMAGGNLIVTGPISGANALEKEEAGTLTLAGTNTYSGATIVSNGVLALAAGGSLGNSSVIDLAAKAVFDVSALTNFNLGTNTALSSSNSVINGASNGVVNLGAQAITLSFDGVDPALTIAQGVLVLSNNALTINSASPLAAGQYVLVQQVTGNILDLSGSYPAPKGTAIPADLAASISVSGGTVKLLLQTPVSNPGTNVVNTTNNVVDNGDGTNSGSLTNTGVTVLAPTNYTGPFALLVDGRGALSSHKTLTNGKKYTLTATASKGSVFAGWVSNGVVVSSTPKYSFVVSSNVQLQALFITNPFIPVAGTYRGLFYPTNGSSEANSGSLVCTVTASGAYTAKISAGSLNVSCSGAFSVNGSAEKTMTHAGVSYAVQLQLDLGGGPMTGLITTSDWTSEISADPAAYTKANPAPEAGKYTLLIPGATNSSAQPGGNGFAAITVSPAGVVTFAGTLGDGTAFSSSTTISSGGAVPLYAAVYGGKGSVLGWLAFTNDAINGLVGWFKLPVASNKLYPAGFTSSADAVGSSYHENSGAPILGSTDAELSLAGGSLSEAVTNEVIFSSSNTAADTAGDKFSFSESTGLFKGVVVDPASGKKISTAGAVLQNQNVAAGYFVDGGGSGSVMLTGAPAQN